MREEDGSWFARWEEELPSPEELMPLTQTLITPDLALAFNIHSPNPNPNPIRHQPPPPPEYDSGGGGGGPDEQARTLKRPRLVWTPQLHKRFVDAVAHLGIKNAVPKTIMQLMSVDGLTRENVASHLQKYRLYLKRMQGINSSSGGGAFSAAEDRLFASAPVPHHFLTRGAAAGPDPFLPYAALHHHHNVTAAAAAAAAAAQQQQLYHQRQMGHFGSPPGGAGLEHGFLSRAQPHPSFSRTPGPTGPLPPSYDLDSGAAGGGRRVLTLFPTGED